MALATPKTIASDLAQRLSGSLKWNKKNSCSDSEECTSGKTPLLQ